MRIWLASFVERFSWADRFLLASLLVLVAGMTTIGVWITNQIQQSVIVRVAETAAVYVDSAVAPYLQNLDAGYTLTSEDKAGLDRLFRAIPHQDQIPSFRIWSPGGRLIYSAGADIGGEPFPIDAGLASALNGKVFAGISSSGEQNSVGASAGSQPLLEIYSPVRRTGSGEIIAIAEFHQSIAALQANVQSAVQQTWLLVAALTLIMYLLLAGFVRVASNTIVRQQTELRDQVERLHQLLLKNQELDERVRRAAAETTALNEQVLRRISAELHDGPAQDLGLALLKLDNVIALSEARTEQNAREKEDLSTIKYSINHALQETRAISSGMGVPELTDLTLSEIVTRIVRTHERRTATQVAVLTQGLPAQASLPMKITLYRVIQESLNNSFRHAHGVKQCVHVTASDHVLEIEISDAGSEMNGKMQDSGAEHLGIIGMRDRVESLGGSFEWTKSAEGTRVLARLPLRSCR